jgi:hypothetical protein
MQGGLLLINGSHDDVSHGDHLATHLGFGLGRCGNGFFANRCTKSQQSFSRVEVPMGPNNNFMNALLSRQRRRAAAQPAHVTPVVWRQKEKARRRR